jgi:hypothetical protein
MLILMDIYELEGSKVFYYNGDCDQHSKIKREPGSNNNRYMYIFAYFHRGRNRIIDYYTQAWESIFQSAVLLAPEWLPFPLDSLVFFGST